MIFEMRQKRGSNRITYGVVDKLALKILIRKSILSKWSKKRKFSVYLINIKVSYWPTVG
jgi:hypothetical protein